MGTFSTKKTLYGDAARILQVAEKVRQAFVNENYEVRIEDPANGQRVWGMIKQSKLYEKALEIAERELYNN